VNLLLASSIDPNAVESLERRHHVVSAFSAPEEHLRTAVEDRQVVVFRSGVNISARIMEAGPDLRLLVRAGSGLDNVDVEHARRQGIRLVRIAGSSAQVVAEFTFALLLDVARHVSHADRLLRQGRWPKNKLLGHLLKGKTLGIVGAGNIGSRVGQLGSAWGMKALGCVANPTEECAARLRAKGITLTDFDTVLTKADFVCLHVPLTAATRHMIDERALSRMKPGAFLVNVARGGVVDEEALFHELTAGSRLGGAALDVHEREGEGTISRFAELPNVVLTPHIGAMAVDSQREIGVRLVELVESFAAGELEAVIRDAELVV
jgi:phosphoglycerate dehydrogenase-like enzyme